MNRTSDEKHIDPEVARALSRLPRAPQHRAGFWEKLESELDTQATPRRGSFDKLRARNSAQFRFLTVAASVLVIGALGIFAINRNGEQSGLIEVAGGPSNTAEVPATSEPRRGPFTPSPLFAERLRSDLFHYDVPVPDGFSVDSESGRGFVVTAAVSGEFRGHFQTSNFMSGDVSWTGRIEPFSEETLVDQTIVRIPLLEENDEGIVDSGEDLAVEQYVFKGEFWDNRILRIYDLGDRVVTAEVTLTDAALADFSAEQILDDIRMFNAAFQPITDCSTRNAVAPPVPDSLNAAQSERFEGIVAALVACDWQALEAQTDPAGFTASFGGGEPIPLWTDSERYGEPILKTLLEHLGAQPGFYDNGDAAWPRPHLLSWIDVTEEMKEELRALGYTEEDFSFYEEVEGYWGWRTGISADGKWQFFVAGD